MAGGRDARRSDTSASLLSGAQEEDPALQHRLARSRREARPNPLLHALAARPDPQKFSDADIDAKFTADMDADFDADTSSRRRAQHGQSGDERAGIERSGPDERYHSDAYASQEPRPLIDPIKFINGVRRSKKLIAATTIAGALIGVFIALSTPKQYEAVGEILVDPRDIKLVDRELVNTDVSPNTAIAIVENQVRVMTSSRVIGKVVDRLNLDTDPEFNGSSSGFGIPNVVGLLRSLISRSDGANGPGRDHMIAVQTVLESVEVERSGKTFVVTVGVTTENAEKSALIANTIIDVFLESSGEMMSTAAGRAANELGAKLAELRASVEEAERKVEAFKGEKDLIDARGYLIGDDEIIKINEQLAIARARTIELSAKAASARALDVDSALGGALPEGVASTLITELRTQYADLLRQSSEAAIKFGAKHPTNRAIQAQLEGARDQLRSELRRIVASMQIEVKRAVELEQKLSARLAALKARQVNVSEDMVALRELERESAAKRAVYESYLLRARETGEQQDLNPANLSVISPAAAPLRPKGPSRSMISIAGTMAGFLLGIGLAGLRGAAEGMFGGPAPAGPPTPRSPGPNRPGDRAGYPSRAGEPYPTDDRPRRFGTALRSGGAAASSNSGAGGNADLQGEGQPAKEASGQTAVPPQPGLTAHAHGAAFAPAPYPFAPTYAMPPFGTPAYATPVPVPAPMPVFAAPMTQPAYPYPTYPPAVPHPPFVQPDAQAAPPVGPEPKPGREQPSSNRIGQDDQNAPANRVQNIRDGLREVRSAIYDLAERRAKRRA